MDKNVGPVLRNICMDNIEHTILLVYYTNFTTFKIHIYSGCLVTKCTCMSFSLIIIYHRQIPDVQWQRRRTNKVNAQTTIIFRNNNYCLGSVYFLPNFVTR